MRPVLTSRLLLLVLTLATAEEKIQDMEEMVFEAGTNVTLSVTGDLTDGCKFQWNQAADSLSCCYSAKGRTDTLCDPARQSQGCREEGKQQVVREDRVGNVEMQLMCFYLPSKYQEHSHPHTKDHHDHDGDHSHSHDEGHSHSHNEDHTHDTKPHSHGDDTKPHSHEEDNHSHSHGDDTKPHDDNHSHSHGDDTKPHNEDHTHPHGDDTKPHYEDHDHTHDTKPMGDSTKPAGRHAPHSPPLPMEGSRVVLYNRPALDVYVRQFGGWALTAATWEDHRQHLLDDLLGKRVKRGEFYTASYNSPMEMKNRRNEVMVQADPELAEIPQAYLLEQLIEQEESASLME